MARSWIVTTEVNRFIRPGSTGVRCLTDEDNARDSTLPVVGPENSCTLIFLKVFK